MMVFIDQMLKIWFGMTLDQSNYQIGCLVLNNIGRILVKFWNLGKMKKIGTFTWMYVHKYLSNSQKDLEILKSQAKKHELDPDLPGLRIVQKYFL